jgi:hypothetical protein
MLKNLQSSPIGKTQFPELMKQAFSWFSQIRQKELVFCEALPEMKEFAKEHFPIKDEFENEMIDSIAEITFYIITHAKENVLHDTVSMITSRSYRKGLLKRTWIEAQKALRDNIDTDCGDFESWYATITP